VLYAGASNYPAWRLMQSLWAADVNKTVRFDSLQPHYSMFHRDEFERELADVCEIYGIGVIPYSPLAAGFATGKYRRETSQVDTTRSESGLIKQLTGSDKAFDALDAAENTARNHNVPVAQIALAWLLAKPSITAPIIGARTIEQLQDIIGASEVKLSEDEIKTLDEATDGF
jgi:aryl-alcohol dehydrogenase-like predicted oxidoreductase